VGDGLQPLEAECRARSEVIAMWLKMCPKCQGDLYLRKELDGEDIVCLQCGRAWAAPPATPDRRQQTLELACWRSVPTSKAA
jgi:hypothetical protein